MIVTGPLYTLNKRRLAGDPGGGCTSRLPCRRSTALRRAHGTRCLCWRWRLRSLSAAATSAPVWVGDGSAAGPQSGMLCCWMKELQKKKELQTTERLKCTYKHAPRASPCSKDIGDGNLHLSKLCLASPEHVHMELTRHYLP